MMWVPVTCRRADEIRTHDLRPVESLTNYVGGDVVDCRLPPYTRTMWGTDDRNVLIDRLDSSGCHHWEKRTEGDDA